MAKATESGKAKEPRKHVPPDGVSRIARALNSAECFLYGDNRKKKR